MKAYWLDSGEFISAQELKVHGVDYAKLDLDNFQVQLDRLKSEHGYSAQDIVELTAQTPNLTAILSKFDKEHLHTDDEVRFVLAGSGIFDIRSHDDRWMRVEVFTSDYISVPARRHHRFLVNEDKTIRCVRLFKDAVGWAPIYRSEKETASV
jgi:1,2-dihydroxy-3-keto-5-methylthiopentene dioxygenase